MIKCNPVNCFGQPALVGRRLTVYDIVTKLYYESSFDTATSDYSISLNDAVEALKYCKSLDCKKDPDRISFCDGCLLRTFEDGNNYEKTRFIGFEGEDGPFYTSNDGKIFYSGDLEELEDSEFGKVTWLIAETIYQEYSQGGWG